VIGRAAFLRADPRRRDLASGRWSAHNRVVFMMVSESLDAAGADNPIRAGQAACSFSWRSPPSRSCRRMRRRARSAGQTQYQRPDRPWPTGPAGPGTPGVPAGDQITVPAQHSVRAHHQPQLVQHRFGVAGTAERPATLGLRGRTGAGRHRVAVRAPWTEGRRYFALDVLDRARKPRTPATVNPNWKPPTTSDQHNSKDQPLHHFQGLDRQIPEHVATLTVGGE
jgi:hypothetical protein